MKSASAAMDTILTSGGPFFLADLYTFTLLNGTVLRYTDADVSLTVGGYTFSNTGPTLSRTKTRLTLGLETSTMTVNMSADDSVLLLGVPWIQAVRQGKLDGAKVRVERFIALDWSDTSAGSIIMFEGEVRDANATRLTSTITVASASYKFDMALPKNTFAPACVRTLFDGGCTLNKASFSISTIALTGSTNNAVNSTAPQAEGYFALGTITFTSGANNGITRTVREFSSGQFRLSLPLPVQPSYGDTFTATAGCNKTQSTCSTKFNNVANFRGFPYVPNPESLV